MTGRIVQTIFVRLLFGVLCLVLLAVGPAAYVALDSYRTALVGHYEQEVAIVAAGLASAAFNATAARDLPTLREVVAEVSENTPADVVMVVDREGRVWAHTDPRRFGEPFSPRLLDDYVAASAELRGGGRVLGTAWAGILETRLQEETERLQLTLALVFGFALLVAAVLAVLFSSSTARPVRRLTRVAREIAGGNLDVSVEGTRGPAEIREMAHAFEEMRTSLRETVGRLRTSYRELDRKVHDLSILYGISEAMNAGDYSEGLLDTILSEAVSGTGSRIGAIWLAGEEERERERLVASRGIDRHQEGDPVRRVLAAMTDRAMAEGSAVQREFERPSGEGAPQTLFVYCIPLQLRAGPGGALLVAREKEGFLVEDRALLDALASHAARCVERAQLYQESITDGLTGLFVSRYFRQRLKDELRTAARYHRKVSVVMIDIDHFKRVNDTRGHPVGDEVLALVARCLLDTVREGIDIAARYGGEEFALILPETGKSGACALAERLRKLIEEQVIELDGGPLRVTVSLGVATSPEDGVRPEALVEAADKALYAAKQAGRNRVVQAGGEPRA